MPKLPIRLVASAFTALILVACGSGVPLQPVSTNPITGPHTREDVRAASMRALEANHFRIDQERDGRIWATYQRGSIRLRAVIDYDLRAVRTEYVSSEGLRYRRDAEGREWIHQRYDRIVTRLNRHVDEELQRPERERRAHELAVARANQTVVVGPTFVGSSNESRPYQDAPTDPSPFPGRRCIGTVDIDAAIQVMKLLRDYAQECYERRLGADPMLAGDVTVTLLVEPDGRVSDVFLEGAATDTTLGDCVGAPAARLTFLPPQSGCAVLRQTYIFSPADAAPPSSATTPNNPSWEGTW